ncbi:hypothetical protein CCUG74246_08510 [Fusobacterium watanabei]
MKDIIGIIIKAVGVFLLAFFGTFLIMKLILMVKS